MSKGTTLRPRCQISAWNQASRFRFLRKISFWTHSCGWDRRFFFFFLIGPGAPPGGQRSKMCPRTRTSRLLLLCGGRGGALALKRIAAPCLSSSGYQRPVRAFSLFRFPHQFCSLKTIVHNIHIIYIYIWRERVYVSDCM